MINEKTDLTEEVFCLNLELKTLSDVLLRLESERWVPGFLLKETEKSHLDRYLLAAEFCGGKRVMDIACGVGKGSFILASVGNADYVEAFDIDLNALRYAKHRYSHPKIEHNYANAENIIFKEKYDFAVSFETIEHLQKPNLFVENVYNSIKPGGYFLVSTPLSSLHLDNNPQNPFHIQEWGFIEFQELISRKFIIEKIYVQLYQQNIQNDKAQQNFKIKQVFYKGLKKIGLIKRKLEFESLLNDVSNFSKIEEYLNQYSIEQLYSRNAGYQIILAKK